MGLYIFFQEGGCYTLTNSIIGNWIRDWKEWETIRRVSQISRLSQIWFSTTAIFRHDCHQDFFASWLILFNMEIRILCQNQLFPLFPPFPRDPHGFLHTYSKVDIYDDEYYYRQTKQCGAKINLRVAAGSVWLVGWFCNSFGTVLSDWAL